MTEPPRPPGEGPEPTSPPPPPPGSYSAPGEAPAPGYSPPPSGDQYAAPPASGGGYSAPPGAGYGPPPGGGYQAPGGYGSPPGAPPAGFANNEDKTWALVAHFGGALGMLIGAGCGGWVAPLIAMLARGNQSPAVRAHAVAALNFQLLWSIIGIVGWILVCLIIGIFAVIAAMLLGIIFGVVAGLKANEGQYYKYPMSISIVK